MILKLYGFSHSLFHAVARRLSDIVIRTLDDIASLFLHGCYLFKYFWETGSISNQSQVHTRRREDRSWIGGMISQSRIPLRAHLMLMTDPLHHFHWMMCFQNHLHGRHRPRAQWSLLRMFSLSNILLSRCVSICCQDSSLFLLTFNSWSPIRFYRHLPTNDKVA